MEQSVRRSVLSSRGKGNRGSGPAPTAFLTPSAASGEDSQLSPACQGSGRGAPVRPNGHNAKASQKPRLDSEFSLKL
jgi:hypothetical protein